MARVSRVPGYLLHKSTGQARVFLPLPGGGYEEKYLGAYGSPESKAAYARAIAAFTGAAPPEPSPSAKPGLTIAELILAFWKHVEAYYVGLDGKPTSEREDFRQTLKVLRRMFGPTPAAEFGPRKLAEVRDEMVRMDWCRTLVNQRIDRVRRCFKWAVSQELVPGDRYESLRALAGLRAGRTPARETEPVKPVPEDVLRATLPHLPRIVRAMVELQRWTGMRPADACRISPDQIDRTGTVWVYSPRLHKTAYRGSVRRIAIGPRAQEILAPYLADAVDPSAPLFSPRAAVEEFHARRTADRKTPRYPSHMARNVNKRSKSPRRRPADRYTTASYGRAIIAGIARANARRKRMADGAEFDPVPQWYPNRLRHLRGTEVRHAFGLEGAQVILGHARADVTQVYAERDFALAAKIAAASG